MQHNIDVTRPPTPTKLNLGICLGRIVFCFLVICCHFFTGGPGEIIVKSFREMAVPFFFVVSFCFASRSPGIETGSPNQMRKRLCRIFLPLWFWGLVLAPFYATHVFPWKGAEGFQDIVAGIVLQFLFGHVYDCPLWFCSFWVFFTSSCLALSGPVSRGSLWQSESPACSFSRYSFNIRDSTSGCGVVFHLLSDSRSEESRSVSHSPLLVSSCNEWYSTGNRFPHFPDGPGCWHSRFCPGRSRFFSRPRAPALDMPDCSGSDRVCRWRCSSLRFRSNGCHCG